MKKFGSESEDTFSKGEIYLLEPICSLNKRLNIKEIKDIRSKAYTFKNGFLYVKFNLEILIKEENESN